MKRFVVILIIVAVVCASAFAADIYLGLTQTAISTSLLVDSEFDKFGIEGALGTNPLLLVGNGIDAISSASSDDAKEPNYLNIVSAMANIYWKAYDGEKFDFRLGVQGDFVGLFFTDGCTLIGSYGPSVGFNYKFNDRFSMNFTGTLPAIAILNAFGDEAAKYGVFYYSNDKMDDVDNIFAAIFIGIIKETVKFLGAGANEIARLSFKWSI